MNSVLEEPPKLCRGPARTKPAEVEFGQYARAVNGELLAARFALPCAEQKRDSGDICESDWKWLLAFALTGESGTGQRRRDRMYLRRLFPNLCDAWPEQDWQYDWALEQLLNHRGHSPECEANYAHVIQLGAPFTSPLTGRRAAQLRADMTYRKSVPVFDLYYLDPDVGSEVLIHKSVVVAILGL